MPHCFVDTAPQGPTWLARPMLADFTDAQFIGNEWASAGLLFGTVISYLLNPAMAGSVGALLPPLLAAQILTAALAVTLWHKQWAEYGWYPTFVPVVSIAPATVLAFDGTLQSIIAGAVLGALIELRWPLRSLDDFPPTFTHLSVTWSPWRVPPRLSSQPCLLHPALVEPQTIWM